MCLRLKELFIINLSTPVKPRHEKTCFMLYANNNGTDQPAHPCSLIIAFVVPCLYDIVPILAIYKISRLQVVSIAELAGLSPTWSETPKTDFLVTRLILISAIQSRMTVMEAVTMMMMMMMMMIMRMIMKSLKMT